MNDLNLCKTCIWFDINSCRNNQKVCFDNSEYLYASDVIRNLCAEPSTIEEQIEDGGDIRNARD